MPIKSEPTAMSYMISVTIPFQPQTLPVIHRGTMTEFKIDYQTCWDDQGKEIVSKVYLPSIPSESASTEMVCMPSVQTPLQSPNPSGDHRRNMTEFKIDYQTYRDGKGKELVYRVCLPSIATESLSAERTSIASLASPLQYRKLPGGHRQRMAEFKIDYQTRRDHKGKEEVYKVVLPSAHKGWAIVAEKSDDLESEEEELPLIVSVSLAHLETPFTPVVTL